MRIFLSILASFVTAQAFAWETAGGVTVFHNKVVAATVTLSPASEWEMINKVVSNAQLKEEGVIVGNDHEPKSRQVFNGAPKIEAQAAVVDNTPTENCEYCGSGDGEGLLNGSTVHFVTWGIVPSECVPWTCVNFCGPDD